jgi:site-specific DNA-methyltransferase (adenine-specific)
MMVRDWGLFQVHVADCLDVLRAMPENSVDSIVTDPPYHLTNKGGGPHNKTPNAYRRAQAGAGSGGFMGMKWDGGDVAQDPTTWAECLRVLKPGGYLLAFSGTRTYHRMACAIEDSGFEVRDQIGWAYGSGFPKSHNGEWGGTALKPAWEPICMARKPLIGTVEANWREHGAGALNIDGCRVGQETRVASFTSLAPCHGNALGAAGTAKARRGTQGAPKTYVGRWPANLIHDGSDEVLAAFPQAGGQLAPARVEGAEQGNNTFGALKNITKRPEPRGDAGSAARFFYCAKASKSDRGANNTHPTVKPTDLMRYLCRLVTPAGGVVLDPFTGSGSTGKAAMLEGLRFIGIEREVPYADIAERRIAAAVFGPLAFGDKQA